MTGLNEVLKTLEDKLEDLQRDTKFCVNNYDYHHKNNEHEIIQNLQDILKDSLQDGQEFLSKIQNVRSTIDTARKKCSEVDEILTKLGVNNELLQASASCAVVGGSDSFHEEQEGTGKYYADALEENKENQD